MLEIQINDYVRRFQDNQLLKPDQCQLCKQAACLRWHGSYVRRLVALAKTYSIPVRRVFCTLCRHTFGLLPSFVSKFHRYAKEVIAKALRWLRTRTYETVADLLSNRCWAQEDHAVAPLTLYFWRRKFGQ